MRAVKPVKFNHTIGQGYRLIVDGRVYVFNIANRFVKEDDMTFEHLTNISDVNVISVLATSDSTDVGLSVAHVFKHFKVAGCSSLELSRMLMLRKGFITTLVRDGECKGIRYVQTLYVYQANVNIVQILNSVASSIPNMKLEVC